MPDSTPLAPAVPGQSLISGARAALMPVSDTRQRASLVAQDARLLSARPELRKLRDSMLAIAGEFVLLPRVEEDLDALLDRGRLFGPSDRIEAGAPSRCHANSVALYESDPDRFVIATGYALSDDSLWRQHTWIIDGDQVVETTEHRLLYFGFIMTKDEADDFCFFNG